MAKVGFEAAQKAGTAPKGGGGHSGLGYASWKDGDTLILRFLTDDPLTVDFYEFVNVTNPEAIPEGKTAATQSFIVAPDLHSGDPNWKGEDWVLKYGGKCKEYGSSELSTPIPRTRTVSIAVLREEVTRKVDGKTVVEYQDVLREIDIKGEKFPAREFVIVKQSYSNFWEQIVGYYHEYGTICDRDYKITRHGSTTDTSYIAIPKREDPDFDLKALQAKYGYGTGADADGNPLTADSPDRFLYCPQTLQEWAEFYSNEERVKRFLGGTPVAASGMDEFHPATTSNPVADEAQAAPPSTTDFGSLRARLEAHR